MDILGLIRGRLESGRTISDGDVKCAVDEIERLRKLVVDASTLADAGMLDDACEMLRAEKSLGHD